MDYNRLSKDILENIGGADNIKSIQNCMTRVRIELYDDSIIDENKVKNIEDLLGYQKQGSQHQFIVGPSKASKLLTVMKNNLNNKDISNADKVKEEIKEKYSNPVGKFLKRIGNIFIPIIPGFIAVGLILGLTNVIKTQIVPLSDINNIEMYPEYLKLLTVFGGVISSFMTILVGYNTSKEFGGTPVLGAVMAAILSSPALTGTSLFGFEFITNGGGIFTVLIAAFVITMIEKQIRKIIPDSLDLIVTPFLTILIGGVISLIVFQPIGIFIANIITNGSILLVEKGGFISGFILAGLFLPLVMTGMHPVFLPVMAEIINKGQINYLLPILAMAGAGQVGASMYVYMKTKDSRMKKTVKSALPVGILGIGEPLIYGVTLPLGKPFLGACIGGAFGGGFMALFKIGAVVPGGISGLVLTLGIENNKILLYIIGVLVAYISGFIATMILGFNDLED